MQILQCEEEHREVERNFEREGKWESEASFRVLDVRKKIGRKEGESENGKMGKVNNSISLNVQIVTTVITQC